MLVILEHFYWNFMSGLIMQNQLLKQLHALDLACDVHYLTGVKEAKYSIFTVAVKVLKSADDV